MCLPQIMDLMVGSTFITVSMVENCMSDPQIACKASVMTNPRYSPRTRAEGRQRRTEIDESTGRTHVVVTSSTGRVVDKNRSDGWRGYRSHLTSRQKKLIRWAIRQKKRGVSAPVILDLLLNRYGWAESPLQYPIGPQSIRMWCATQAVMANRGKEWP
jgi:hypothetical protein